MFRIFIVGLGLMGGSMAYAARGFLGAHIVGYDSDQEVLNFAKKSGAIDEIALDAGVEAGRADMIFLCMRPGDIVAFLRQHGGQVKRGAIVTDIGGVKREIMEEAKALPKDVAFIGGHPMAGKERGGFAHADAELYQGANYILIPREGTDPAAVATMERFVKHIGCKTILYPAVEEHDAQIAYTSQLMHVFAAAVAESGRYPDSKGFDGNSFRGATRVARLDAQMWADLFLRNREPLCDVIRELCGHLLEYAALIEEEDRETLTKRLSAASRRKEEWDEKEIGGERHADA